MHSRRRGHSDEHALHSSDLDITTGRTTADAEVVNIWSAYYSYLPVSIPFPGSDESSWFEYVEASGTTGAASG